MQLVGCSCIFQTSFGEGHQAPDYCRSTRTKRQATVRVSKSARPQAARLTRQMAAAPQAAAPEAAAPAILIQSDDDEANKETVVPWPELPENYVGFKVSPHHQEVAPIKFSNKRFCVVLRGDSGETVRGRKLYRRPDSEPFLKCIKNHTKNETCKLECGHRAGSFLRIAAILKILRKK